MSDDPEYSLSDDLASSPSIGAPPSVRVNLLVADAAQVADGKLYILGAGLTAVGPRPQPMGVAIRIEVPWDRANVSHEWRIELLDEDGHPLMVGDRPLVVQGNFEAGRPVGLRPGTPLCVPLAINFPSIPVTPGKSYTWQLSINGASHSDWRQSFFVRQAKQTDTPSAPPPPG